MCVCVQLSHVPMCGVVVAWVSCLSVIVCVCMVEVNSCRCVGPVLRCGVCEVECVLCMYGAESPRLSMLPSRPCCHAHPYVFSSSLLASSPLYRHRLFSCVCVSCVFQAVRVVCRACRVVSVLCMWV